MKPNRGYRQARLGNPGRELAPSFGGLKIYSPVSSLMKSNRGYRQARLGNPGRDLALGLVIAGAFFLNPQTHLWQRPD